ncbi:putative RING finger protein [Yarrowia sp. B02]|nr:putative RING finger protein [Yarrowia sp. B02]
MSKNFNFAAPSFVPSEPKPAQKTPKASKTRSGPPKKPKAINTPQRNNHRNRQRPEDKKDLEEELAALSPRKGKVNISHLLEFSPPTASRQAVQSSNHSHSPHPRRKTPVKEFDKDAYTNANFSFVVKPGEFGNPDHVDMSRVVRVLVPQASDCLICLCEPTAPRMLGCGHIMCLACLKRFNTQSKECPLCLETVNNSHVKPVIFGSKEDAQPVLKTGETHEWTLLGRDLHDVFAAPANSSGVVQSSIPSVESPYASYSRLRLGTAHWAREMYQRELEAIFDMRKQDEFMFGDDGHFADQAVEDIMEKMELEEDPSDLPFDLELESPPSVGGLSAPKEFYFYAIRPNYFLAPLDIKVLKHVFGHYSMFPPSIKPRIEHVEHSSVTVELRKRSKYLANLPVGAEIGFVECDWRQVLPKDKLAPFAEELRQRFRRHKNQERRDDRNKRLAEQRDHVEFDTYVEQRGFSSPPLGASAPFGSSPISSLDPVLGESSSGDTPSPSGNKKTVWGKAVNWSSDPVAPHDSEENGWGDIAKALEAAEAESGTRKKGKKKLVLVSRNAF